MNFYKHHIGDYAAATAHLSWDEDMAYTRLLRWYYQHEKPIPADQRAVYRLARASSKQQREAVDAVLGEFFTLEEDGYHQKRCDEELERANAQAEANRKVAAEREERRRQAREASTNRASTGNESSNESCNPPEHESLRSREPSQTPDSRRQTPDKSFSPESAQGEPQAPAARARPAAPPTPIDPTAAGRASLAMRRGGLLQTNPSHPSLLAAIAEGATEDAWEHTAREAVASGKGFAWVIATVRGRLADAAANPTGATHAPGHPGGRPSLADRVADANRIHDERERAAGG